MHKVAFQVDNIKTFKKTDNSLAFMREYLKKGVEVYFYYPEDMYYKNGDVFAYLYKVLKTHESDDVLIKYEEKNAVKLDSVDMIWVRQNPPFNNEYQTYTYLLETISNKVLVINNPRGIRNTPEKTILINYPQISAPTVITKNRSLIYDFLQEHKEIIIKPLNEFGGSSVFYLKEGDFNLEPIIESFTANVNEPFIVQKFIKKVTKGDKRVVLVDGEPLFHVSRVPAQGSILSNTAFGATITQVELNDRDIEICNTIKPYLLENGLFFVGIDIIDGNLIEVNVTSPSGTVFADNAYGINSTEVVVAKSLEKLKQFKLKVKI